MPATPWQLERNLPLCYLLLITGSPTPNHFLLISSKGRFRMTRDYDDSDFDVEDRPSGAPDDRGTERMEGDRDDDRDDDRGGRRPRIDSFEKMKVWQEAHALTMKVFAATPKLPTEQQAGLALQ